MSLDSGYVCPVCESWYAVNTWNQGRCGDLSRQQAVGCPGVLVPFHEFTPAGNAPVLTVNELRRLSRKDLQAHAQAVFNDAENARAALTASLDALEDEVRAVKSETLQIKQINDLKK